jgi:hypothetical protein
MDIIKGKALDWNDEISCAMCLTEDPKSKYYADLTLEETWFCAYCWERSCIQQAMIDNDFEQEPEVEN